MLALNVAVVKLDLDGVLVGWNEACQEITDVVSEDILGIYLCVQSHAPLTILIILIILTILTILTILIINLAYIIRYAPF